MKNIARTMNVCFEALVTKFLIENLQGYRVQPQNRLRHMMHYEPGNNPLRRRSPTPRPDVAIMHDSSLVTLLDTKYRDLWEYPLPRDMLYQLAIYALGQEKRRCATILYPTTDDAARLQVISVKDPIGSSQQAQIVLRPINLTNLGGAITRTGAAAARHRARQGCRQ